MIPNIDIPNLKIYGPITISPFGVLTCAAVVLGFLLARRRVKRIGLRPNILDGSLLWLLVSGFAAAHLVSQIFYFPKQTVAHPVTLLDFRDELSSFGGLLGAATGAFVYFRREGVSVLKYTDAIMFGLVPAWAIGRLGCTVIFDHPGQPTRFLLGMADQTGVVRHNLGLYEMIFAVLLSATLYATKEIDLFDGLHTAMIQILYSPIRFLLDFLRTEDRTYIGLTFGQYVSVIMLLLAAALIVRGLRLQLDSDSTIERSTEDDKVIKSNHAS